jgi:hypothetical protein
MFTYIHSKRINFNFRDWQIINNKEIQHFIFDFDLFFNDSRILNINLCWLQFEIIHRNTEFYGNIRDFKYSIVRDMCLYVTSSFIYWMSNSIVNYTNKDLGKTDPCYSIIRLIIRQGGTNGLLDVWSTEVQKSTKKYEKYEEAERSTISALGYRTWIYLETSSKYKWL